MPPTVDKRCELNRYCGFVGPFVPQHVVELGRSRPQVVGRCLDCGSYVCNRCADRRPVGSNRAFGAAELLCPLDGQPLGRGDEWLTFHAEFARTVPSTGHPGIDVLVRAMAGTGDRPVDPATARARELVLEATALESDGRPDDAIERCREALSHASDFALARFVRRRIFEAARRHVEALEDWRTLLALPVDVLSRALPDDDWLAQRRVDAAVGVIEISRVIAAAARLETYAAQAVPRSGVRVTGQWLSEKPMSFPSSRSGAAGKTQDRARGLVSGEHGSVIAEYCPAGASRALLVLCHETDVPAQQRHVFGQLEHLFGTAPDVPVFVEGLTGRPPKVRGIRLPDERLAAATRAIENQQPATSCAVHLFPTSGWLNPADSAALLERQEAARSRVDAAVSRLADAGRLPLDTNLLTCSLVAAGIEEPLRGVDTQQLWQLRRNFEQDGRAVQYLDAVLPFVQRAGLDLSDYQGLRALTRMLQLERSLDFNAVERQRLELVEQLAALSGRVLPPAQASKIDAWCEAGAAQEQPLTRRYDSFLRSAFGVAAAPAGKSGFLSRVFGKHPSPAPALGAPEWFVRVLVLSKAYSEAVVSYPAYHSRLQSLLDALGIQVTEPLRSYFEYVQLEPQVDTSTIHQVEIPQLDSSLRQALAASSTESRALQIMHETEEMVRLLGLTLPSPIVRRVLGRGGLVPLIADLDRLHAYVPPPGGPEADLWESSRSMVGEAAQLVDRVLPDIATFYDLAFQRSRAMARTALDGSSASRVGVLVCGRFHVPEVERFVRDTGDASLVVVAPFPMRSPTTRAASRPTWAHPHREHPGSYLPSPRA